VWHVYIYIGAPVCVACVYIYRCAVCVACVYIYRLACVCGMCIYIYVRLCVCAFYFLVFVYVSVWHVGIYVGATFVCVCVFIFSVPHGLQRAYLVCVCVCVCVCERGLLNTVGHIVFDLV